MNSEHSLLEVIANNNLESNTVFAIIHWQYSLVKTNLINERSACRKRD